MSFKDNYFKCFGCGKYGDVITIVQHLFNLNPREAAIKINEDFGLGIPVKDRKQSNFAKEVRKVNMAQPFKEWEQRWFNYLMAIYKTLEKLENSSSEYIRSVAYKNKGYYGYLIDYWFINKEYDNSLKPEEIVRLFNKLNKEEVINFGRFIKCFIDS